MLKIEAKAACRVEQAVGEHTSLTLLATLQEVREHVAELVYPGFVVSTPTEELAHLPRFQYKYSRRWNSR